MCTILWKQNEVPPWLDVIYYHCDIIDHHCITVMRTNCSYHVEMMQDSSFIEHCFESLLLSIIWLGLWCCQSVAMVASYPMLHLLRRLGMDQTFDVGSCHQSAIKHSSKISSWVDSPHPGMWLTACPTCSRWIHKFKIQNWLGPIVSRSSPKNIKAYYRSYGIHIIISSLIQHALLNWYFLCIVQVP